MIAFEVNDVSVIKVKIQVFKRNFSLKIRSWFYHIKKKLFDNLRNGGFII